MSKKERVVAVGAVCAIAVFAVLARWILFTMGVLYGETVTKMASLAMAGVIVACGAAALLIARAGRTTDKSASGGSIVSLIAALLGLATTAYAVSELVTPNTPVQATAPACPGTPVYGAKYYAITEGATPDARTGVNARSGPGRQFPQVNRFPWDCTLGFDGYCIGPAEPDFELGTPDQRWLLVHNRKQFVSSAVVLSQSAEKKLGSSPNRKCPGLGGEEQADHVSTFTYNSTTSQLAGAAPGAAAVGFGFATGAGPNIQYHIDKLASNPPAFTAALPQPEIAADLNGLNGEALIGASVCLADNVPVTDSLKIIRLVVRGGHVFSQALDAGEPATIRERLAEIACNSTH